MVSKGAVTLAFLNLNTKGEEKVYIPFNALHRFATYLYSRIYFNNFFVLIYFYTGLAFLFFFISSLFIKSQMSWITNLRYDNE